MFLSSSDFGRVVASTPLVSIDLIVHDLQQRVLLGQRLNRPAQGYWFVPGGRIRKNESIREAFRRLTQAELGVELGYEQAHLLGVYDHFYSDCIFCESTSTHYVALGMVLELTHQFDSLPEDQHDSFAWWPIQQVFWFSVNWRIQPFELVYNNGGIHHAQTTKKLHRSGEGFHPQAAPG